MKKPDHHSSIWCNRSCSRIFPRVGISPRYSLLWIHRISLSGESKTSPLCCPMGKAIEVWRWPCWNPLIVFHKALKPQAPKIEFLSLSFLCRSRVGCAHKITSSWIPSRERSLRREDTFPIPIPMTCVFHFEKWLWSALSSCTKRLHSIHSACRNKTTKQGCPYGNIPIFIGKVTDPTNSAI